MVPYYHPRVFERVNITLLDLFDRVEINRYNADGTIRKKIRVPLTIHYSKNFADFILSTQDHPESKHTTPILGLRMGGLERNASGTTSRAPYSIARSISLARKAFKRGRVTISNGITLS